MESVSDTAKRKKKGTQTHQPKSMNSSSSGGGGGAGEKDKSTVKMVHCTVANCTYSARYRKDLVRHYRRHTGEKPFACSHCPKAFSRHDKLLQHTRVHDNIRSFSCSQCEYKAFDTTGLKKHQRNVHSTTKPYSCQLCSYCTKDPTQLNVHIRYHTGDTPYFCPETDCQKGFKTQTDLKRHIRIHSGEKPYACIECEYTSSIKSNLRTHIKRKHSGTGLSNGTKTVGSESVSEVSETTATASTSTVDLTDIGVPNGHSNLVSNTKLNNPEVITKTIVISDVSEIPETFSIVEKTVPPANGAPVPVNTSTVNSEPLFDFACKLCCFRSSTIRGFKTHLRIKHKITNYDSHLPPDIQQRAPKKGIKVSRNVSSLAAKAYKCPSCPASFVTENSLSCHSRQHQKPLLQPPPAPTLDAIMEYPSKKHLAVLHEKLETFGAASQQCQQQQVNSVNTTTVVKLLRPGPAIPISPPQQRPIVIAYAGPSPDKF